MVPLLALVAMSMALVAAGCGAAADDGTAVETRDPAKAFAPVVVFHPAERLMPMSARWFLARSALWFAEGEGACDDRKIAVGRLLKAQRNEVVDWLFVTGIGRGPTYWREPYKDDNCDFFREAYRYYANQLTRPHDPSPDRAPELQAAEGYFLDLMDWGRRGPAPERVGSGLRVDDAAAWYESERIDVDGEPGLRLTYWMLFGMHEPRDVHGRVVEELSHEGDWERVEVVLRGEDDDWELVHMRLAAPGGGWREVDPDSVELLPGPGTATRERTHPLLYAARGTHTLYPRPGTRQSEVDVGGGAVTVEDAVASTCSACARWETWRRLAPAGKRDWFGFGGAWGAPGETDATTGPLGPHGEWWVSKRDPNAPPP